MIDSDNVEITFNPHSDGEAIVWKIAFATVEITGDLSSDEAVALRTELTKAINRVKE